jgi:PilZ domain
MLTQESTASAGNLRRHARKSVIWPGNVTTEEGMLACSVLDLSNGGARLRMDQVLPRDAIVNLRIAGVGRFPARVVWCREQQIGIRNSMHQRPHTALTGLRDACLGWRACLACRLMIR